MIMTEEIKKVNIMLDASQIDMFQLCEARYNYRYVLNKGLQKKAEQLDRGTLVHSGMEKYYKLLKDGIRFKEALPEAIREIKITAVEESDLSPAEVGRVCDVVKESITHWESEDAGFVIKAVEEPFLYLLFEDEYTRFYVSGKIDLLVDMSTLRRYYENMPIDHKSYNRKFPVKRRTNQFINYAIATGSEYLMVNRIGFQETVPVKEKMERPLLSYDQEYLSQWKQNMVKLAKRYVDCFAENSWEMNFTSCDKFNRLCEFDSVCEASGQEAKFYKLNNEYVDLEPWDVTKILSRDKKKLEE